MADLDALLADIREACEPLEWGKGQAYARAQAVATQLERSDQLRLQVKVPGRSVPLRAILYLDEGEWDCTCTSRADVCEHVAAAAIALQDARARGDGQVRSSTMGGRVAYALRRDGGALVLERTILGADGERTPLTAPLASVVAGNATSRRVAPTQADLAIDHILGNRIRGAVDGELWPQLLPQLVDAAELTLDGAPVRASARKLTPRARVVDHGAGVRLRIEPDPALDAVVAPFVGRAGDVLHPLGQTSLGGNAFERLPRVKSYEGAAIEELLTKTLPSLERRIPVAIETERLPTFVRDLAPRVALELELEGGRAHALALIVYGDPPLARCDGERMVWLAPESGRIPVRQPEAEARLRERLRDELDLLPGRRRTFEGDAAARFVARSRAFAADSPGATVRGGEGAVRDIALGLAFTATAAGVRFELRGRGPSGELVVADAAAAVGAWSRGDSLVPLLNGDGWAPLPADVFARCGPQIAALLAAADAAGGAVPRALGPEALALARALDVPPPAEFAALRPLIDGFTALPPAPEPADLTATLRDYQRLGVAWLRFLGDAGLGAVLADDMGLGKTLQTMCALERPALVVCPTSVLPNWKAELEKFRPGLRVSSYHGRERGIDPAADVTLTTYALLRIDREPLAAVEWATVVLDEAQAIKNPESQAAAAAFGLRAARRVALSGTPVENRLEELWSLLHFTNPGVLGGRREFDERYARPIAQGDEAAAARLRARIKPFVLRRTKREVAPELPPRTDLVVRCELDAEERATYDAVRAATRQEVVERLREGGGVLAALEALLRLRQAACHRGLLPGGASGGVTRSSKVDRLLEQLDESIAEGHKALVFSQWTGLLDLVEPDLHRRGLAFARLDGSTRDRGAVVARFQAEDGPPVLLISLKAGGTGLNLTAADHVFLLDPWWNPAAEDQAADRAHRIGQDRPVFVHRLVASDTVEDRMLALQARKRELAAVALSEGAAAGAITRDDLLALLDAG